MDKCMTCGGTLRCVSCGSAPGDPAIEAAIDGLQREIFGEYNIDVDDARRRLRDAAARMNERAAELRIRVHNSERRWLKEAQAEAQIGGDERDQT